MAASNLPPSKFRFLRWTTTTPLEAKRIPSSSCSVGLLIRSFVRWLEEERGKMNWIIPHTTRSWFSIIQFRKTVCVCELRAQSVSFFFSAALCYLLIRSEKSSCAGPKAINNLCFCAVCVY